MRKYKLVKIQNYFLGCFTISMLLAFNGLSQNSSKSNDNMDKIELRDIRSKEQRVGSSIPNLVTDVEVNKNQKPTENGIEIILTIKNSSSKTMHICNPLDYLNIQLLDQNDNLISLPKVGHRLKINRKDDQNASIYPFKIIEVSSRNAKMSDNQLKQTELTIQGSSELKIKISIDKIAVKNGSTYENNSTPKGNYKINLSLWLIDVNDNKKRNMLQADNITVNYID